MTTIGAFTWTGTAIEGPAGYMADKAHGLDAIVATIQAGTSAVFNYAVMHGRSDTVSAMLVAVQTHYAGWKGMRQFNAARESQMAFLASMATSGRPKRRARQSR